MSWGELVHTDTPGAHAFRRGVARRLAEAWPERAAALIRCGRGAVKVGCGVCGSDHLVPFRCGARTCPACCPAAAAGVVDRVGVRVDQLMADAERIGWDGPGRARRRSWRIVVLTCPTALTEDERFEWEKLGPEARMVRSGFPKWWKRTPWGKQRNGPKVAGKRSKRNRFDTGAAIGVEIAPGGMLHIHAGIYGEWVDQRELQRLWSEVLGVPLAIVHVSGVKGNTREQVRKALKEALKYATKGEHADPRRLDRAAAVEVALRRVRRVELYGALRAYGSVTEDVTAEDLHAGKALACEDCGQTGLWSYGSMWEPRHVRANGGFGRVDLARLEAFYRAREPDPGPEVCP